MSRTMRFQRYVGAASLDPLRFFYSPPSGRFSGPFTKCLVAFKLLLVVILGWTLAATAHAGFVGLPANPDGLVVPDIDEDDNVENFTAGNSIGTIGFSELLHDGSTSLTFPVTEGSLGNNILYNAAEEGVFSASSAPGALPNETIYTFEWKQASGATFIPAGATFNNQIINCLSFEMGSANTGSNHLDVDGPFVVNHPDVDNDGIYEAEFKMYSTAGDLQFSGIWFVATSETGFEGRVFIKNGGNPDLSQFSIGRGVATVSILRVPEPTGIEFCSLGLGLLLYVWQRDRTSWDTRDRKCQSIDA